MKRKYIIIGAVASVVVFVLALGLVELLKNGLGGFGLQGQSGWLVEQEDVKKVEKYQLSFPIVVAAPFKYAAADIELAEVNPETTFISEKLWGILAELQFVDKDFADYPVFTEEIIQLNRPGLEERLLLLHPDEVEFSVKVLRVGGVHPLRPDQNPQQYAAYSFWVRKEVALQYGQVDDGEDSQNLQNAPEQGRQADGEQSDGRKADGRQDALAWRQEKRFSRSYLESINFTPEEMRRIFAAGEIIPARAVDRLFLNETNNYTLLFDRFRSEIESAEIAMALLENPISGDPKPCTGCTVFVGDERNAAGFKEVGLDVLSFGNHAGDGGLKAIIRTEEVLAEQGIAIAGLSSKNLAEASRPAKITLGGKQVVDASADANTSVDADVISNTDANTNARKGSGATEPIVGIIGFDDVAYFSWATASRGGANRFSKAGSRGLDPDYERIKSVISEARSQVDILIVYPSWGVEYRDSAVPGQQRLAHAIIDAGADMIIGSHPHWIQNFEIYKGKPIFYSLGNFIFDQTHTEPTRQSMVVNSLFYKGKLKGFEITPLVMCGYHQTRNNLAGKIISGQMSYADVDNTPEKDGCVYWQPKPVPQDSKVYQDIWKRFTRATKIL